MTQTFRSRDEQVEELAAGCPNTDVALAHILEAEARGAAEERARLEKSLLDPTTVHQNLLRGSIAKLSWEQIKHLYPANVAALEARVKELEGENARLKTAQFYGHDGEEGGSEDISTFFDDHEPGTILEIDGYRLVNTKWVLWDGHFPHVFDTEDEARASLTREGGV